MGSRDGKTRSHDVQKSAEPTAAEPTAAEPAPVPVRQAQRARPMPPAVATLTVGAAGDRAEHEADRTAATVMARIRASALADAAAGTTEQPSLRRHPGATSGPIGPAGGSLDEATHQRLSGRLGLGQALPGRVRSTMESAFGAGFGDVRVHTDETASALNEQLSSTAFTVGTDVFFSRGAFRPDTDGGQELIAHELAHVRSESAAARRRIRRAVGFEFETGVMAKQRLPNGTFAPLPKATVLQQFNGFRMETDENTQIGSTIEFVIDPPVNEKDRKKLTKILDKLTKVSGALASAEDATAKAMLASPFQGWTPTHRLRDIKGAGVSRRDVWVLPNRIVEANPQVTGGIDFDKVIDMMSEIGGGDQSQLSAGSAKAAGELEKMSPASPQKFASDVINAGAPAGLQNASKQLQGLAALLVSYLTFGAQGPLLNYPKLISNSILMRTDFGSLYMSLPGEEREVFAKDPGAFVTWVLGIANLPGNGAVFERGVRLSTDPGHQDYGTRDPDPDLAVERQRWLYGITMGGDVLSAKKNPGLAAKLEGLGALGDKWDAVAGEDRKKPKLQQRTGAVMEFRNMRKNVFWKDWGALALGIFDYIVELNAR